MEYTYQLKEGDRAIVTICSAADKASLIMRYMREGNSQPGDYSVLMERNNEEVLRLNGMSREDALAVLDSLGEDVQKDIPVTVNLTKGKKIVIKVFVGLFMGFGLISLLIRLIGYSKSANTYSLFNLIVTSVLMCLLGFGIWIYFFPANKKTKKSD